MVEWGAQSRHGLPGLKEPCWQLQGWQVQHAAQGAEEQRGNSDRMPESPRQPSLALRRASGKEEATNHTGERRGPDRLHDRFLAISRAHTRSGAAAPRGSAPALSVDGGGGTGCYEAAPWQASRPPLCTVRGGQLAIIPRHAINVGGSPSSAFKRQQNMAGASRGRLPPPPHYRRHVDSHGQAAP